MVGVKRLPLSEPQICGNEWRYVKECLDGGWVSSAGKFVNEFERKIASYMGSEYAVSCINGTSALHIALLVSGVGPEDEVIVPAVTFIAPINAVRYAGAEPVFMDCDDHLNMDADKTKEFIMKECCFKNGKLYNKSTGKVVKAILPVHVFGHPVDIEPIMDLSYEYNLKVIEDATESLGSYYREGRYKGKKTGVIGDVGCLSFNGNKIITAGGGGMLLFKDKKLAEKAGYLTTQAKDDGVRYIHYEIGYNYRLSNVQAAIGVAQLEMVDEFIKIKRNNFDIYDACISGIAGLQMLKEPPYGFSNHWFYALIIDKRGYKKASMDLVHILSKRGIEARPLWYPSHRQASYKNCQRYRIEKADSYLDKIVNLPCSTDITRGDIKKITGIIRAYSKKEDLSHGKQTKVR